MSHDPRHATFADPFADARPASGAGSGGRQPIAARADVLRCYEEAVQEPLVECTNLASFYCQAQEELARSRGKEGDWTEAKVLREDFCSTATFASTWLALDPANTSQGVDIDLDALRDTRRRLGARTARLVDRDGKEIPLASTSVSTIPNGESVTQASDDGESAATKSLEQAAAEPEATARDGTPTTWAVGAASDRFERKFQAKRAAAEKRAKQAATRAVAKTGSSGGMNGQDAKGKAEEKQGPRLTLVHSDVLELPVPSTSASANASAGADASPGASSGSSLQAPDIIAALNYALAYFHTRAGLLAYLRVCYATLARPGGTFIADMFGGPPTGEIYPPQEETWARFSNEPGFAARGGDGAGQFVLPSSNGTEKKKGVSAIEVRPPPQESEAGTRAEWPRGKLQFVRKGDAHGGFEYWREDGPVDWITNRFRMSLSFRFGDGSWLRDVFSYDFRIWTLKEITEAMEEVGFVRVKVHIIPRNIVDDTSSSSSELDSDSDSDSESEGAQDSTRRQKHQQGQAHDKQSIGASGDADADADHIDFAHLLRRTEREERAKALYRPLVPGEKVFTERSFGTYIVASVP